MAKPFQTLIVTPTHKVYDGPASYVSLPAYDGQLGVMHQRAPLLVQLGEGELRLDAEGSPSQRYHIRHGFAQMHHNVLTILTEHAAPQA